MAYNERAYNQAYYLIHRKHIREQRRLWYIKNREAVRAHQAEYNRKNAARLKAARGSQKPVSKQVYRLPETNGDSPRDNSTIGGATESRVGEHGDPLPSLPSGGTRSRGQSRRQVPAPSANVVSKQIDKAEAKAIKQIERLIEKANRKESIPSAEQTAPTSIRSTGSPVSRKDRTRKPASKKETQSSS